MSTTIPAITNTWTPADAPADAYVEMGSATKPVGLGSAKMLAGYLTPGLVSVRVYGATGDGSTNDRVAIQAALDSGFAGIYFPAGTYLIGSTGLTVPATVTRLLMSPSAVVTYTGTGTGILIDTPTAPGPEYVVAVRKTVADWDPMTGSGTDTTSIGVKLRNAAFARLTVLLSQNFAIGAQMLGDGDGVQFCDVNVVDLLNNKVGLQTKRVSGGWCNQNVFRGGSINISSGHTSQLAGTRYIDLIDGNTNTFVGISIQNDMAERSLLVTNGNSNIFLNLRYEANQANAVRFEATSSYNQTIGGYFSSGTYTSIVSNAGGGNIFTGPIGLDIDANVAAVNPVDVRNGVTGRSYFQVRYNGQNGRVFVGNSTDLGGLVVYGGILCPFVTPASAAAAGESGTFVFDTNYVYVCVATNSWKRAALSTW